MAVCYSPSSPDLALFEKYRAKLLDWVKANPGTLVKAGGKSKSSDRHQDAPPSSCSCALRCFDSVRDALLY
jgi:hypothetical protein